MDENTILYLLKTTIKYELENNAEIKGDSIEITLPNGAIASISIVEVDYKSIDRTNPAPRVNDYVSKHDYSGIGENKAKKLLLRNLQDVRDYAIDVAQTNIVGVQIYGDAVCCEDNSTWQIVVKLKAK